MREGAVTVLLVVAILIGAGAGYLVGYANQRTITSTSVSTSTLPVVTTYTTLQTSTTQQTVTSFSTTATTLYTTYTQTVTTGCVNSSLGVPISAPASYNASERGFLALVMNPGTNATIYVGYCPVFWPVELSRPSLAPSVDVMTCYGGPLTGGGCSGTPAKAVTITPVPSQALLENDSLTIVTYFVSANANSTGYYAIYIPYMCPGVGLDVGYPPSWLNHSDFPWMGFPPCPYSFGDILSVSGANITYVGLGYGFP
jgi:hypothetical protein